MKMKIRTRQHFSQSLGCVCARLFVYLCVREGLSYCLEQINCRRSLMCFCFALFSYVNVRGYGVISNSTLAWALALAIVQLFFSFLFHENEYESMKTNSSTN
jgi:hypothetical protein